MTTKDTLLDDPIGFWDERHQVLDAYRAGGDRGISTEENYEFYAYRLGRVIELLRRHRGSVRPLRVLDAGCGRGLLTDGLARCGHDVRGIDSSESAVEWARDHHAGAYEVSALAEHRPPMLYDAIVCMDVLFHVVHDDVWRRSLEAFAGYARAESTMILSDVFGDTRSRVRDYIVHRTAAEYDAILEPSGFRRREVVPYDFGANPNAFAVYDRRLS